MEILNKKKCVCILQIFFNKKEKSFQRKITKDSKFSLKYKFQAQKQYKEMCLGRKSMVE